MLGQKHLVILVDSDHWILSDISAIGPSAPLSLSSECKRCRVKLIIMRSPGLLDGWICKQSILSELHASNSTLPQ